MEEKSKEPIMKLTLKSYLLIIFIIGAIIIIGVMISNQNDDIAINLKKYDSSEYSKTNLNEKVYYTKEKEVSFNEEYQESEFFSDEAISYREVASYVRYKEIIHEINSKDAMKGHEIEAKYSNPFCNYLVIAYCNGYGNNSIKIFDMFIDENSVVVICTTDTNGVMAGGKGYFIAIPVKVSTIMDVVQTRCYLKEEIENIREYGTSNNPNIYYYNESGKQYNIVGSDAFKEVILDYSGDYDIEYTSVQEDKLEEYRISKYMSYSEYADFCTKWNITQKYNDESKHYIVVSDAKKSNGIRAKLVGFEENKESTYVYTWSRVAHAGENIDDNAFVVVIPTNAEETIVQSRETLNYDEYMQAINHYIKY